VRESLSKGNIELVNELLGQSYFVQGIVQKGRQIGRTIGFPTANIRVDEPFKVLPGIGIYAVWVNLNGIRYKGMLYIGCRPTIDNNLDMALEVNILNFSGDIYNAQLEVIFVRFMREDIKFESLEALRAQLEIDREEVDALLSGLE
jgi:riboflavin kinase/FMN adenylyltransferase